MYAYPYGDSQQLNLDWILTKFKELEDAGAVGVTIEDVATTLLAPAYTQKTYLLNDIVYYNGKLWYANQAITSAESWTASHWNKLLLSTPVANLVRQVAQNTVALANLDSDDVANASEEVDGDTVTEALDTLKDAITSLGSDDIANDSSDVSGSTVTDAVDALKDALDDKILYYTSQTVSAATSAQIMRIPSSGTDSAITTDTVVLECTFAAPSYITTDVTWTSYDGYIAFTGTCTTATTANVTLGTKGN